jgi:hypothetical protein
MKTKIDWALGAGVRVQGATHSGGGWTLETVRVGPSRCPGCGRPSTSVHSTSENRILKAQSQERLKHSDVERARLGEIGHRLGRKGLGEVATAARPDILAWYRRLVARKFDGSLARRAPGRPPIGREVEELIVRMAEENHSSSGCRLNWRVSPAERPTLRVGFCAERLHC